MREKRFVDYHTSVADNVESMENKNTKVKKKSRRTTIRKMFEKGKNFGPQTLASAELDKYLAEIIRFVLRKGRADC